MSFCKLYLNPMNIYRLLNQFLAGIMIMIYHLFVGQFMDRTSVAFIVSMYIFVLTMLTIVGMPINEETGHIEDSEVSFDGDLGF